MSAPLASATLECSLFGQTQYHKNILLSLIFFLVVYPPEVHLRKSLCWNMLGTNCNWTLFSVWQKRKLGSSLSPPLTSVLTFICCENCYVRHILLFPVCLKVCNRATEISGTEALGLDWSFAVIQIFGFPLLLPSCSAGRRWLCFTSQRGFLHFSCWLLPLIHCTHLGTIPQHSFTPLCLRGWSRYFVQ